MKRGSISARPTIRSATLSPTRAVTVLRRLEAALNGLAARIVGAMGDPVPQPQAGPTGARGCLHCQPVREPCRSGFRRMAASCGGSDRPRRERPDRPHADPVSRHLGGAGGRRLAVHDAQGIRGLGLLGAGGLARGCRVEPPCWRADSMSHVVTEAGGWRLQTGKPVVGRQRPTVRFRQPQRAASPRSRVQLSDNVTRTGSMLRCPKGSRGRYQIKTWTTKDGLHVSRSASATCDRKTNGWAKVPPFKCVLLAFAARSSRVQSNGRKRRSCSPVRL